MSALLYLKIGESQRCRQVIVPSTTPLLGKIIGNIRDYAALLSALQSAADRAALLLI